MKWTLLLPKKGCLIPKSGWKKNTEGSSAIKDKLCLDFQIEKDEYRMDEALMKKRILVTGGLGFIGSAFIRYCLDYKKVEWILNLDAKKYAANEEGLAKYAEAKNYVFVEGDINNQEFVKHLLSFYEINTIVHFAAESHVDRSIQSPEPFLESNVAGTLHLLEVLRLFPEIHFHHVSTDEVYGSADDGQEFFENSPYQPNSPYSASKAASDHFVRCFQKTYGLKITMSHCGNNFGPYQHSEKLIPTVIRSLQQQAPIPVYGNGKNIREWIYVEDHVKALWAILEKGSLGETYNIGTPNRLENLGLVKKIISQYAQLTARDENNLLELIQFVEDRKGHDYCYQLNCDKLLSLGWKVETSLEQGLLQTIQHYLQQRERRIICVIPARLHSSRLEKKILKKIAGKYLIQRTYEAAIATRLFDQVLVAIDDEETAQILKALKIPYQMSSKDCPSGTDRLIEIAEGMHWQGDIWLNWQCDEPFLTKKAICDLLQSIQNEEEDIWTLKQEIHSSEERNNSSIVKVVTDNHGFALYFSRSAIPFDRDSSKAATFKHIGLYAYSTKALKAVQKLKLSSLERVEKLEQLRYLQNGLKIRVHETLEESLGIDLLADLKKAEEKIFKF